MITDDSQSLPPLNEHKKKVASNAVQASILSHSFEAAFNISLNVLSERRFF